MSQMLKSSGAMGAATLTSRMFGLMREVAYAGFMGDTWVAGAFVLAFTIPNLFRRLLGEGALTAAFIPVFKEKEKTAGEAEMWRSANAIISGLVLAAAVVVMVGIAVASIALAVRSYTGQTVLMLQLLRLMFPYLLLVCVAAVFMGMLNARGHFFIPALSPTLLNLVMIASVLLLAPYFGDRLDQQIFGLAVGVLVAGVAQALFQLPLLRREGFRYTWINPWPDPTVRHVVRQMIPATIGVAAFQINVLLTQGLAFWKDAQIVASFNYAVRLMELPQGLFGISLATYLLPTLSGLAAEKKYKDFRSTLGQGIGYLVFLNLIASILLVTLAEPTIRLVLERGKFDENATFRATEALTWLAPGLLAFSCVNIFARAFYALGDIKTPMRISIFCLGLNILLSGALVWKFRQAGLGAANTITSSVNMGLLAYALRRKLGRLDFSHLWNHSLALVGIGLAAAAVAVAGSRSWENYLGHGSFALKLGAVFVPMSLAAAIYFGGAWWLHIPYADDMIGLLPGPIRRRFQK
jgi:putative peptidoglycan lipid II flippase